MFEKLTLRSMAAWAALTMSATTAPADTFGTGASQFTLDFVPISGSSNPTRVQTIEGDLNGFGIVEYDYRVGVHEITNDQWNKFVAELGVAVTGNPSDAYDRSFRDGGTGATDVPANNVSWYEAAQFVNWLNTSTDHQAAYKFTGTQGQSDYTFATWDTSEAWGGTNLYRHKDAVYFLPDDDEWFKAAYWNGTSIQTYATQPGDTLHQGDASSGTGWNYYDGGSEPDPFGPWDVGSGSEELNGTYDMMGNIWEWMESPWDDPSYGAGSRRNMRGGYWGTGNWEFRASSFHLYGVPPTYEHDGIGFRVASVPGSVSATLVSAESGDFDAPETWDIGTIAPNEWCEVVVENHTVDVAGVQAAYSLLINHDDGMLLVHPGSTLDVTAAETGTAEVAAGTLDLAGTLDADSLATAGQIHLGDSGLLNVGAMQILGGSVDTDAGGIVLAGSVEVGAGNLNLAGTLEADSLTTAGQIHLSDSGLLNVGTMQILGGSVDTDAGGIVLAGSVEVGAGNLNLAGTLEADSLTTAGQVQLGDSGLLNVGTMQVLGGSVDTGTGRIVVAGSVEVSAGNLNLAGTLEADSLTTASRIQLGDKGLLNVGTMQVLGGAVNTGGGKIVLGESLQIGNVTMTITGADCELSGTDLFDPTEARNLGLSGGMLIIARSMGPPGAIATWRFEERGGPTTADSSTAGNDHLATLSGPKWVSDGPYHTTALSFDGDDYVEVANAADIQFGSPFTIAMWIKTSEKGVELLGKGNDDGKWRYLDKALCIDAGGGQVEFIGPLPGTLAGSSDVANGEWHYLVVTYNGGTAPGDQEAYVDGVNDTKDPLGRLYIGGADMGDVFRLGSAETTEVQGYRAYVGLMDDVSIYDRSLNASEVAKLFEAASSVDPLPAINLRVIAPSVLALDVPGAAALGGVELENEASLTLSPGLSKVSFQDLTGRGSVVGDLSIRGMLSPGDSLGRLGLVGDVTMEAGSTYRWELGATGADLTTVDLGMLLLETGWKLQLHALGDRAVGPDEQLCLFAFGDGGSLDPASDLAMDWPGALELLGDDWDPGNREWNPTLHSDITGVYITGLVAVPEPAMLLLLATGVLWGLLCVPLRPLRLIRKTEER